MYYIADGIFHNQAEVDAYPHWEGAQPGDIRFKDINNDGKINADDRIRSDKNEEPRFVAGLTLGLNWKNWDLMALFQGATGGQVYIQTWSGTIGNFLKEYYDQRWTPENPTANGPRTYEREDQYWISNRNTYFLRKGDYLRLKNVELGYTFSAEALKKPVFLNFAFTETQQISSHWITSKWPTRKQEMSIWKHIRKEELSTLEFKQHSNI